METPHLTLDLVPPTQDKKKTFKKVPFWCPTIPEALAQTRHCCHNSARAQGFLQSGEERREKPGKFGVGGAGFFPICGAPSTVGGNLQVKMMVLGAKIEGKLSSVPHRSGGAVTPDDAVT